MTNLQKPGIVLVAYLEFLKLNGFFVQMGLSLAAYLEFPPYCYYCCYCFNKPFLCQSLLFASNYITSNYNYNYNYNLF